MGGKELVISISVVMCNCLYQLISPCKKTARNSAASRQSSTNSSTTRKSLRCRLPTCMPSFILSPFTKDGVELSRILFLDADYVKRNEKYLLGFDSLATITYNRGVITLIGDEMWRVQQVASRTSAKIGESGLNILNMDAQEETSRILIVVEDAEENIQKAIMAVHDEISKINFV